MARVRRVRIEVEPEELGTAGHLVTGATRTLEAAELTFRVLEAPVTDWAADGRLAVAARELFEALRWASTDGLAACGWLAETLEGAARSYAGVEHRVVRR
jgi:hypothetical protein